MENKLFATWKYDAFPYFLGGEVIELRAKGWCTVKGYDGMQFKYEKIYPLEEGERLYKMAMTQVQNHNNEVKRSYQITLERIKKIMDND